jgi:hypothetical protein
MAARQWPTLRDFSIGGIAPAQPEEIDAILALSSAAIPLHVWVAKQPTPKHDRGALEGLFVGGFCNLGGG